jgi:gluconate 5-dehydrogenase
VSQWLGLDRAKALVVGAGGLGGASAIALAAQGTDVRLADRDEHRLAQVVRAAKEAGCDLATIGCDVATPEGARALIDEFDRQAGVPQVFVHAVGRNDRRPVLALGDNDWASILTLNLSSAWWLGQAVGRRMVEAGYGRMVFMSSVSSLLAHPHHAPYAASKGGINQLVRVMAREWAPHGVTVNAVAPGYVETPLTRGYLDTGNHRPELVAMVPAGRLGTPQEVADAVTFLASDRAGFVTGHVLVVDGGRTLV